MILLTDLVGQSTSQAVFSGATLSRSTEDYYAGYSSIVSPKSLAQVTANTIAYFCGTEPADYSTHMVLQQMFRSSIL